MNEQWAIIGSSVTTDSTTPVDLTGNHPLYPKKAQLQVLKLLSKITVLYILLNLPYNLYRVAVHVFEWQVEREVSLHCRTILRFLYWELPSLVH